MFPFRESDCQINSFFQVQIHSFINTIQIRVETAFIHLDSVQIPLLPRASPSRQPTAAGDIIGRTEAANNSITKQAIQNSS